ncbi:anthranilate synthase component II (plastid) [Chondrus crispus]|uniref:Anthranilate synthase component 2 n=1 Tax=Chondrus crispus TaxID=2769 RepID=M5DDC9_CHOCR|nr:anthranilate synthase component II [Chondrus crispus]CCP38064.1 anthranilate synthase component II [Chondrus crispus]|eukprot:YP_007627317.1 anthranilate synthase component II (plastid) [Chondrus crispus]
MILIIDNYDSFTQNLVQYVGELGFDTHVSRNDEIDIHDILQVNPSHVIISPGPGEPSSTGISLELIKLYANKIPILGVCLGHQSIAYVYGGKVIQLSQPVHGKISEIVHNNTDIFHHLPNPFLAARYHSLVIDNKSLPSDIEVTARTHDGIIMGCRHKSYPLLRGIQFHPESLWTDHGRSIIRNFLLM